MRMRAAVESPGEKIGWVGRTLKINLGQYESIEFSEGQEFRGSGDADFFASMRSAQGDVNERLLLAAREFVADRELPTTGAAPAGRVALWLKETAKKGKA